MTQVLLGRCTASISKDRVLDLLQDPRCLVQRWRARATYRRELARLLTAGPHLVRDLGLDEAGACEEIRKPFWRA